MVVNAFFFHDSGRVSNVQNGSFARALAFRAHCQVCTRTFPSFRKTWDNCWGGGVFSIFFHNIVYGIYICILKINYKYDGDNIVSVIYHSQKIFSLL